MKTVSRSQVRRDSRVLIQQVIEDHVLGPAQCLHHGDVLELRVQLREAYPFDRKDGWPLKVWREEVRTALGYANNRKPKKRKCTKVYTTQNVMPAMREWAEKQGLLGESATASAENAVPK